MISEIVIGSRGSDLALWQARFIKAELEALGHGVRIEIIKTQGDRIQHLSFDKMEGKGFFTTELETALRERKIDLAVHSYKDLETNQPDDLCIAASSYRANPADILLINPSHFDTSELWNLKKGAHVGTSSARRKVQLIEGRSDLVINDIRGNVPTRIDKLSNGEFDAIVLAKAGIDRLELDISHLESFEFDPEKFIPAPAQGVLACQTRSEDSELINALAPLHNKRVATEISTERLVLNLFEGGCQLPLGAFCREIEGKLHLIAVMAPSATESPRRIELTGTDSNELAIRAVEGLKKKSLA